MARFLVLEGVDGSGKTTQAGRLMAWLQAQGRDPLHLREPGSTAFGEGVRRLLLDPDLQQRDPRSEALLFFAARRALLLQQVQPALAAGRDVVCERFTPSTLAYQGGAPADARFILALEELVVEAELRPHKVLILDMDPAESLARASQRAPADGFEQRGLEFLRRVRQGYLAYAAAHPQRVELLPVDGLDAAAVFALILEHVSTWLLHE